MNTGRILRNLARLGLCVFCAVLTVFLHPFFSGPRSSSTLIQAGLGGNLSTEVVLPFHLSALRAVFPIGRVISAVDYYIAKRNSQLLREELQDKAFGARPPQDPGGKQVYILAIGESSRPDRWQLAGYGRATNPVLSREPDLVWLHDVVTPWTYTLAAVPVITTPKPGTDSSLFVAEKSVLSLFREAGFRTYWISNQARPRDASAPVGQIASEADETRWTNATDSVDDAADASYDEVVLTPLREILGRPEMRQLVVLHLMGSHDAYFRRYPAAFNHFRPSLTDSPDADWHSAANSDLINNAYDNSVLYTDHVLGSVISALSMQDAVSALYYMSDHGESLFDGRCSMIGHGGTARPNYQVSAFAWLSPRYMQAFPEVMPALQTNSAKRISTEDTLNSLADLAHIAFASADRTRSIFSHLFREHQRVVHVAQNLVDWDKARFIGRCEEPTAAE